MAAHVIFLGTGNAFCEDGRGTQALLLQPARGPHVLVDIGPTLPLALERFRVDTTAVGKVFLTHFHGDHTAGWPFLFLRLVFIDQRTQPLRVFGAEGSRRRLEGLLDLSYDDIAASGHVRFPVEYVEIPVERAEGIDCGDGIEVDVLPVDHHPSSIAYRFRLGGRSIAVSGDTRWCPALETLARGADLLVLECTQLRGTGGGHISFDEVAAKAQDLQARKIVLVHTTDAVAAAVAARTLQGLSAAHDGLVIEV
jgi:ribonuclease BN (tRNA processing enzyme)